MVNHQSLTDTLLAKTFATLIARVVVYTLSKHNPRGRISDNNQAADTVIQAINKNFVDNPRFKSTKGVENFCRYLPLIGIIKVTI